MKVIFGLGALAVFLALPIWRDLHHRGTSQSGWGILWDQLVLKERAEHIAVEKAVINAKVRHNLGRIPGA